MLPQQNTAENYLAVVMMRIRTMAVMMKMALVEKCNKGPQCWREKKQFSDKNYFLKDLKNKTFATGWVV